MVQTRAAAALTSEIWSKYAAIEAEDSGEAYRDALAAAELASIVLRIELAAVEKAWAEEHASLLDQLAHKDQTIWNMAQQSQQSESTVAARATGAFYSAPPKPPRIGHRERPEPVPGFNLKASGAMVLTPPKRKIARATYTVARLT